MGWAKDPCHTPHVTTATMSSTYQTHLDALRAELADIERQQADPYLPHSDQQLLDQALEDVMNRIDALETSVEAYNAYIEQRDAQLRDVYDYLGEEEESDTVPTPPPSSPARIVDGGAKLVTFAPPPPPLSATRSAVAIPAGWRPFPLPPPIVIPLHDGTPSGPPAPRHGADGARICNCDGDGQCAYCEEEAELERWNNMVDDREGCARCSGCAYCSDGPGYDGADEV